MRKFFIRNLWWMTCLLALALLVIHSLPGHEITVDTTSVVLVLIIFLSPFLSAIRKIKFGEIEAEIDPEDVQSVRDAVETQLGERTTPPETFSQVEIETTISDIHRLAETDPVIALAKLRIEIEKVITKLYRRTQRQRSPRPHISLGMIVHDLANQEVIPKGMASPIREVISICNRAIHGGDIRERDASTILDVGTSLLERLFSSSRDYLLKPIESNVISESDLDEYRNARYRLITAIPYVENPVRNVRIIDQEGLDDFLEGYEEYAEFIVGITRLHDEDVQPEYSTDKPSQEAI